MPGQLTLAVRLDEELRFSNFQVSEQNAAAVARLRQFLDSGDGSLLVHGVRGCGKSHLLQASCQQQDAAGADSIYLPLGDLRDYPAAELLAGFEERSLVCLDDIDVVAGAPDWETALFNLFNNCAESGARLLMAASKPPEHLGIVLADLRSRLQGGLLIALGALEDEARIAALILRAHERGMLMESDVAQYIWLRNARDMPALMATLERLDAATLEAGRRLSIPFVRQVMGW